jgi:glycosyltransferase involved in cell wall biosynthesis
MRKIIYISLLDWYFTKQRPHHFAELLSKEYKVIFICRASWGNKHLRTHDDNQKIKTHFKINKNLDVIRIKLIPFSTIKIINRINQYLYLKIIFYINKIFKSDIFWITHPEQLLLIPKDFSDKVIYDCMDNYSQFVTDSGKRNKIVNLEKRLINKADIIFASSNGLGKKLSSILNNDKVNIIKNAVDFESFNKSLNNIETIEKPNELSINKRIIGYFGGISSWFDLELVCLIANKFKECEIIIIGPLSDKTVLERTSQIQNIKWLGSKMYSELPHYLYYFDVCIMPFIINDLIKDVNPVKLYEYLSMGKPVVAPKYDEIIEFDSYVYLADSKDDFLEKITLAMNENDPTLKESRMQFSKLNTWENRVKDIIKNIEEGYHAKD